MNVLDHSGTSHSTRASRRGAAGVASVVALVTLQLLITGAILTGTRDQGMTIQRLDALRSQYAMDGVNHMALRELFTGTDEDSDGTVGSIASGVPANGPLIGGARAAATVSVSGLTTSLTIKGTRGAVSRATSTSITVGTSPVDATVVYADATTPTASSATRYVSGAWTSPTTMTALSANVCWQVLKNGPTVATPARALVTLAQDSSLWINQYDGTSWGASTSLASSAGASNLRVFDAAYENRTGNLMVVYRKSAATSLYYRTYTTTSPTEQSFSMGLGMAPTRVEMAGKPGGNEIVAVVSAGPNLAAAVWDGTSWGHSVTLESSLPQTGRPYHVAYMNQAGKAIVVWTAVTGDPKYMTWDGSNWSLTGTLPAIAGGGIPVGWMKLVGSPKRSSNEVLMACIGTDNQINVNNWTGSAWGTNLVVETAAQNNWQARVDIAYRPDGAGALVAWHKSGQTALRYRTWSGSAWSAQSTGPDMLSTTRSLRLERGYNSNEIMMLVRRSGSYGGYNVYSESGTVNTGTTVITGNVGTGGMALPPAPPAVAGSTNLNPSGGTIAPGSYGSLTVGNNTTIGFTAGSYVFTSWTMGNSNTYLFDTSAGPITLSLTSGNMTGGNTNAFINTGGSQVEIDIDDGDLDLVNNAAFLDIRIIIHNGKATMKNNTDGSLTLWASGNITFKNNGTISPDGLGTSTVPTLSAVLWTAGVPGTRTDLCAAMSSPGIADPCDLAGSPMPSSPIIDFWAAVSPQ